MRHNKGGIEKNFSSSHKVIFFVAQQLYILSCLLVLIDTQYRIMSVGWLVTLGRRPFKTFKICMKKQLIMMILLVMNHDDHDEGSRECKNVLECTRKAR